jgi:hypothetical protein
VAISEKLLKPRIKQKFSEGVEQMYISPIEIIQVPVEFDNTIMRVEKQLNKGMEEQVYRAVAQCEIVVDKEELIKALQYDREQYRKGYDDGIRKFAENLKEYFPSIAKAIDHTAEELIGGDEK